MAEISPKLKSHVPVDIFLPEGGTRRVMGLVNTGCGILAYKHKQRLIYVSQIQGSIPYVGLDPWLSVTLY